jgi:hypothetical protein
MAGIKSAGWYVITADITKNSGSLESSAVYLECTSFSSFINLFTAKDSSDTVVGSGVDGRRYRFSKLLQYTGSNNDWQLYALSGWTSVGSTPAKTITWHECSVRDATPEEIARQTVLAPLETSVATHTTQINTLVTENSSQASSITSLNSSVGTLNSNVSTLSSTSTSHTDSIATLNSTVSTQGVTISSNSSAITTINGNVTTLFGRAGVKVDVNGRMTGWEINNNGTTGNFVIHTDNFEINKPGTGERTTYGNGAWKIYDASNVLRVKLGNLA